MPQDKSLSGLWEEQQRRWDDYRQPRSLWLWTAIGSAALTLAIGFTAGGWTTRAAAEKMAADAARAARVELVANACAASFAKAYDFETRIAALKTASELERTAMLQTEGWVTLAGMDAPLPAAAILCADRLANRKAEPQPANAMTSATGSNG
ncbi:MAG: hypothetical protein AB7F09_02125 [Parvibaculaceae bacterium]